MTLYRIADGNLRVDHTSIGTPKSLGSDGEASSRRGLRGTEDVGNGVRAVLNFEQDFDLSDNSAPQGDVAGVTPTSPTTSTGSRLFGRRASGASTPRSTRPARPPTRSRPAPSRAVRFDSAYLYLVYSKIVNQGAAAFIIGDNSNHGLFTAANVPAGFNPRSAQFGIRHLF